MPAFSDYWSLRYSARGPLVTRVASQRAGAVCAWAAQQAGASPSHVTLASASVFLVAAVLFVALPEGIAAALACVLLFELGYALDCADGQLARATQRVSAAGATLDIRCDYVRNLALAIAFATWLWSHGLGAASATALVFWAGTWSHLATVEALRQRATRPATPPGALRELATAMLDTPTMLLVAGALRPFPQLLAGALAAFGLAYLAMSLALARARLS